MTAQELRHAVEEAADGLVYTSESDRPFEWFQLPRADWPLAAEDFARAIGAAPGTPLGERDLDEFFKRHIETSDPYDARAQEIRPRYEALRELLRRHLRDVRVYRVGYVEVACYVVGGIDAGVAGVRTVAVET
ncbi:MAG TPA: nuclease A inhibitor family protein [Longimicrobium sp.]|jgi:hypothetical protein